MITLKDYTVTDKLYETRQSLVYRGRRESNNHPVILKILKNDYPSPNELGQYRREFEIISRLEGSGTVRAYELQPYQNGLALVLEDPGGVPLASLLQAGPLPLAEFLPLALELSTTVGAIHKHQIIHKDIKPANILVVPPNDGYPMQVKLIDFGLSTILTHERPSVENPEVLEGTLAYISPEQTGRMNRTLDYRTDFYSLGVTLYEMITGRTPFEAQDPLELVHSHIAKAPPPPDTFNPTIPPIISEIILKLMAKTAEDRYQSAAGLEADLRLCLHQLQEHQVLEPFALGQADMTDRFQIPQKLYGRETETAQLLAAFEQLNQPANEAKKSQLVLVIGAAGIGKSALVHEIHKPIVARRGYFIAGKYDQLQRDIPYSALSRAFQDLVRQLLTEREAALAGWQEALRQTLGPNGQVIIDVIPEVELLIGPQPAVETLGAIEAQNRFNLVFQAFVRLFCQPTHPLVLFLDDLQWADAASLKLIERLLTDEAAGNFLLLGAYRDNEVEATHPLLHMLGQLREAAVPITELKLAPLTLAHVTRLISDTLHQTEAKVTPLARLVTQKTGGNPFFVNEFLRTIYLEQWLHFDHERRQWQWDASHIAAQNITANVVELMLERLRKLPGETQQALRLAACIGNSFDLNTLLAIHGGALAEAYQALLGAVRDGLIFPTSAPEMIGPNGAEPELLFPYFRFAHDRIQQAAYALLTEPEQQAHHWQIGQVILAQTPPDGLDEAIFELVNQMNAGRNLLQNEADRLRLAELNLRAGRKALSAAAYTSARELLRHGLACLDEASAWTEQYDLTLALHKTLAEAEYLNGDFDRSKALLDLAISQVKTPLEEAQICNLLIVQHTLMANYAEAIQLGRQALHLLEVELPANDFRPALQAELKQAQLNLGERNIIALADEPEMTAPDKRIAVELLGNLAVPARYSDIQLFALITAMTVNLSLRYGPIPKSTVGYSAYGMLLGSIMSDYAKGYAFGQLAIKLSERFNNQAQRCQACFVMGTYLNHWVKPLREADAITQDGYEAGLTVGEFQWTGYTLAYKLFHPFYRGAALSDIRTEIDKYLAFTEKTKNRWASDTLIGLRLALPGLMDRCHNPDFPQAEARYLAECRSQRSFGAIARYQIVRAQILYLCGAWPAALQTILEARELLSFITNSISVAVLNFYYSLTLAALSPEATPEKQQEYHEQLVANQKQLKLWAENSPQNFESHYLLVEAELARLAGETLAAMTLYDEAIAAAKATSFTHLAALGNELAARFWQTQDKPDFVTLYLRQARHMYRMWGAQAKVADLEARYEMLLTSAPQTYRSMADSTASITRTGSSSGSSTHVALDIASLIKASQAISGEIVLENLLARLMTTLLESAGAERGLLLLDKSGEWVIEAVAEQGHVEVLQSLPLKAVDGLSPNPLLSASVVNYVIRTNQEVVLDNAAQAGPFTQSAYVRHKQPKSVLGLPLLKQGKTIGVLYLENNLAPSAFTPNHLEMLRLLSSQMVISLDNATLYRDLSRYRDHLEELVASRTAELAQAKEVAEQERHKAEVANQAKSQFLSNMSHELRTPLNGILGYTQILRREKTDHTPLQKEGLNIIEQSGQHLLTLITDILDLSKIEAGKLELYPTACNLADFLNGVVGMMRIRAQNKSLGFALDEVQPLPVVVSADEKRLRQILINLLTNAIKFTEQGSVTLRVASLSRELELMASSPTPTPTHITNAALLRFEVIDTGIGLSAGALETIFQPFEQVGEAHKRAEGTGLGLSITRRLVELMGGTLEVTSKPGQGSTFSFALLLPEVRGQVVAASVDTPDHEVIGYSGPKRTILVVDDKAHNRAVMLNMLAPLGFEVLEADSARTGIQLARTAQPDLIVMDMIMPEMTGFEAVQALRRQPLFKETVIFGASASVFDEDRQKVYVAGCDAFLSKPVELQKLLGMLAEHLQLEWVYETKTGMVPPTSTEATPSSAEHLIPPREEIEILHELAMIGNMIALAEQAIRLEQSEPAFRPFTSKLCQLAKDFEEEKILALLERHLGG
jgi:predicted ATPase/signal transduction histidine kinase/DNA-binding NarL/FixJ family response regulator/tRNA A-37 threonylcarbamoyl transferase component Bud32